MHGLGWHCSRRDGRVRVGDAQLVALLQQRGRTTLVDAVVHARVELDGRTIEPRDRGTIAGDRVAEHRAAHADRGQEWLQHVGFGALIAERGAAVPVRPAGVQHRVVVGGHQPFDQRCVGASGGLVGQRREALTRAIRACRVRVLEAHQAGGPGRGLRGDVVGDRGRVQPIDLVDAAAGQQAGRAAVQEDAVVHDDHYRLGQDPAAVAPVGAQQTPVSEVAGREPLLELRGRAPGIPREPLGLPRRALGRVLVGQVGRVLAASDVAQVAEHVHRLVVADHDVHLAAAGRGFLLQSHQKVHHLAGVVTAIEQVAEADEVRAAAGPAQVAVYDALGREQRHQLVVGAVHVGKRHHAFDSLPFDLGGFAVVPGRVRGDAAE